MRTIKANDEIVGSIAILLWKMMWSLLIGLTEILGEGNCQNNTERFFENLKNEANLWTCCI